MKDLKVGIIGCGNMGGAIARGMVGKGDFSAESVFLFDKVSEKMLSLADRTGCVKSDLHGVVSAADILVIAVKPQDFKALLSDIGEYIRDLTMVSVMAGVRIKAITGQLGRDLPVARAMPNMAAAVGEGMTCVAFNGLVKLKEEIKDIFRGIGNVLELDERHMDTVTALSGSGPAYLFHLAEAMIEAGQEAGLDKKVAAELVEQTLYGSSLLLKRMKEDPAALISKVASKGGTTEAALQVFEEKLVKAAVKSAIHKAKQRSEQLSEG